MKYIFYCIYNTQYLDGKNKVNKSPWLDAMAMMMGGSLLWVLIVVELFYFYVLNQNIPGSSVVEGIIAFLLLFYSHYFWFIKDKKYEMIYDKYKQNGVYRTKEKLISISYIFVPLLIFMLISIIWHNRI